MKKRAIGLLLIMTVALLQGCKRAPVSLSTESPAVSASVETLTSTETETNPEVMEDQGVLLVGEKNVYFVKDGESKTVFETEDDDTTIFAAEEVDGTFYIVTQKGVISSFTNDAELYLYIQNDFMSSKTIVPQEMLRGIDYQGVWNGKVYFNYYDWEHQESPNVTFYYDPQGDAFNKDDTFTNLTDYFRATGGHYPGYGGSVPLMMHNAGYVLVEYPDGHEAKIYNEAGQCVQGILMGESESVNRIAECVFVTRDYENSCFYLYETETNEKTCIGEVEDLNETTLCYLDSKGAVFSKGYRTGTFVDYKLEYYYVSFDDMSWTYITSVDLNRAGAYSDNRLNPNFTVNGDTFYFLDTVGGDNVWQYCTLENDDHVSLDLKDKHIELGDYGTVSFLTDEFYDDATGKLYGCYAYETFKITKDVPWKDDFNAIMTTRDNSLQDGIALFKQECENYRNDVDWSQEYTSYYSDEAYIKSLDIINDDVIQLGLYYYGYSGGAHGYYGYNYIWYNTTEQKEFNMREICSLSEDDLADLIADYTIQYWKACGSDTPFYTEYVEDSPELEDEMRATFRQYASYDSEFMLGKDCMYVCYPPYLVGSYAAGYINVPIPYEALEIQW